MIILYPDKAPSATVDAWAEATAEGSLLSEAEYDSYYPWPFASHLPRPHDWYSMPQKDFIRKLEKREIIGLWYVPDSEIDPSWLQDGKRKAFMPWIFLAPYAGSKVHSRAHDGLWTPKDRTNYFTQWSPHPDGRWEGVLETWADERSMCISPPDGPGVQLNDFYIGPKRWGFVMDPIADPKDKSHRARHRAVLIGGVLVNNTCTVAPHLSFCHGDSSSYPGTPAMSHSFTYWNPISWESAEGMFKRWLNERDIDGKAMKWIDSRWNSWMAFAKRISPDGTPIYPVVISGVGKEAYVAHLHHDGSIISTPDGTLAVDLCLGNTKPKYYSKIPKVAPISTLPEKMRNMVSETLASTNPSALGGTASIPSITKDRENVIAAAILKPTGSVITPAGLTRDETTGAWTREDSQPITSDDLASISIAPDIPTSSTKGKPLYEVWRAVSDHIVDQYEAAHKP